VAGLSRSAAGAPKLDVDFVTYGNARRLKCRTTHANAKAAASDEHRASSEGDAVERADHSHLTAPTQFAGELERNVDHRKATRFVLVPAADTPAEQCHDPPRWDPKIADTGIIARHVRRQPEGIAVPALFRPSSLLRIDP
jgi:hypothetical protein